MEEIERISGGAIRMSFPYDNITDFLSGQMEVEIDNTMMDYLQKIEQSRTEKLPEAKPKKAPSENRAQDLIIIHFLFIRTGVWPHRFVRFRLQLVQFRLHFVQIPTYLRAIPTLLRANAIFPSSYFARLFKLYSHSTPKFSDVFPHFSHEKFFSIFLQFILMISYDILRYIRPLSRILPGGGHAILYTSSF